MSSYATERLLHAAVHASPSLPVALQVMFVQEDSSCCLRVCLAACGGLNLRALQLHMYEGNTETVAVDRPCRMGAGCCCPVEMTISSKGQQIGMVRGTAIRVGCKGRRASPKGAAI